MKNTKLIGLASAICLSGLVNPVPIFAQRAPASETYVSVVRAADLNLRTQDGQRELARRLAAAARNVCGTASEVDLLGKNKIRSCRNKALSEAKARSKALIDSFEVGQLVAVGGAR